MNLEQPTEEDVQQIIVDFFKRSIASRPTARLESFVVQVDQQQMEAKGIKRLLPPKLVPANIDTPLIAPPHIDSFYPYWSPWNGGMPVDIYGSGFLLGCGIDFGGLGSVSPIFYDSTHVRATTPSYGSVPPGDYDDLDITVTNDPNVPGPSDSLGTIRFENVPSQMTMNGQPAGSNAGSLGPIDSVTWPVNCYRPLPTFFPFIGKLWWRSYAQGSTPGSYLDGGIVSDGTFGFRISGGASGTTYVVDFQLEPSWSLWGGTPVTFSWTYNVT